MSPWSLLAKSRRQKIPTRPLSSSLSGSPSSAGGASWRRRGLPTAALDAPTAIGAFIGFHLAAKGAVARPEGRDEAKIYASGGFSRVSGEEEGTLEFNLREFPVYHFGQAAARTEGWLTPFRRSITQHWRGSRTGASRRAGDNPTLRPFRMAAAGGPEDYPSA